MVMVMVMVMMVMMVVVVVMVATTEVKVKVAGGQRRGPARERRSAGQSKTMMNRETRRDEEER